MTIELEHPERLIPFYVNGTLDSASVEEIELHIRQCDHCRKEVLYLSKLREQIKSSTVIQGPGEFGLQRLLRDVRKAKAEKKNREWLRPALAAAMLVIAIQTGLLWKINKPDQSYHQLGGQDSGIQVIFQPGATEAQIRILVQSVNARIINGPSTLGIYRVELPVKADSVEHKKLRVKMIAELRRHPEVIREVLQ